MIYTEGRLFFCLRLGEECYQLILKRQSEASPPACKPMRPTGWKRARRGCSAYASESETTNLQSSIVNLQFRFSRVRFLFNLNRPPDILKPATPRHRRYRCRLYRRRHLKQDIALHPPSHWVGRVCRGGFAQSRFCKLIPF